MKLKIKIKETKKEQRPLTLEEWALCCIVLEYSSQSDRWIKAKEVLYKEGIDPYTLKEEPFNAAFAHVTTEPTRDATEDEEKAIHMKELFNLCDINLNENSSLRLSVDEVGGKGYTAYGAYIVNTLKDKEIILELIED